MRIVFFGTPELALPTLDALTERHELAALVCRPDKPQGRSKKLVPPPVKTWALEHDIETQQPIKLNDGVFETWLRETSPDICVLVAYGRILKQAVLDIPTHGFLNMHPSLLPKHRGPSPIQSAILSGDAETGVTIMRLDAGTDTGDVLLQEATPIGIEDTSETLGETLAVLGADLMMQALELVEKGTARFTKQDEALATHTHMFTKEDARILWNASAQHIHNLVRACRPWPVAWTTLNGETLRIHKTHLIEEARAVAPGEIIEATKNAIRVGTGDGVLAVDSLQVPGKRAMTAAEYLNGRSLPPGTILGDA